MDKLDLLMYFWFCFLLGWIIPTWVELTMEVWNGSMVRKVSISVINKARNKIQTWGGQDKR